MTLSDYLGKMRDLELSELQLVENPFARMAWDKFIKEFEFGVHITKEMATTIAELAKKENMLPVTVIKSARAEIIIRSMYAWGEFEDADDFVNWRQEPIENHEWISVQGHRHKDKIEYKWAFLFGEPYYEHEKPGAQGVCRAYWEPNPNRTPRGRVKEVVFAKVVCLQDEYPTFLACHVLVDDNILFMRHEEREGQTEFHVLANVGEVLPLLKEQELRGLGTAHVFALLAHLEA